MLDGYMSYEEWEAFINGLVAKYVKESEEGSELEA